jgi:hypothetical protein
MADEPIASAPMRAAALASLLASARHEASILEHHLENEVHDDEAVLAALRSLAASGRGARIRILVQDASRLQMEAPRLLALVQRMSSAMSIRVPSEVADLAYACAYTTVDAGGLLFRPEASRHDTRGPSGEVGERARLQGYFDAIWERSQPAAELRRIDL